MKKHYTLTLVIASFLILISFHTVSAQGILTFNRSTCGDGLKNDCTLQDAAQQVKEAIKYLIAICLIIFTALIPGRLVYYRLKAMWGKSAEMSQVSWDLTQGLVGLGVAAGGVGLILAALSYLGLSDWMIGIFNIFADGIVPHAYAQSAQQLASPVGTNSLYDFFLLLVRLVVRWFIYPAIIAIWVWTGFAYVAAQGNPEKLMKVHMWLFWSFIITAVAFLTEAFLFALRGTVQAVIG